MTTETKTPRHGWRLAWRQQIPSLNYSTLAHMHSKTIFPVDDKERLEAINVRVNAGYRAEDGSPLMFQWLEWYDAAIPKDDKCKGNYWEGPIRMEAS